MGERVVKKIARLLQWLAGGQEARAADRHDDIVKQAACGRPGYFPAPKPMATRVVQVEIAHLVGNVEAQIDIRAEPAEILDAPHQPFGRELRVERHFQLRRAARRLPRF